jgi:hypothetical protein
MVKQPPLLTTTMRRELRHDDEVLACERFVKTTPSFTPISVRNHKVTQIKLSRKEKTNRIESTTELPLVFGTFEEDDDEDVAAPDGEAEAESDEEDDDIADVVSRWLAALNAMALEDE